MVTKKDVVASSFYKGYLESAKGKDPLKALRKNFKDFKKLLARVPPKKIDYAYAKGKWTMKESLQHIIDTERVFAYRALRFARKDQTPLPGFEQADWAAHASADKREWNDLIREFIAVRKSTEIMFASFNEGQLLSVGTASENQMNVLALGFIIAGHTEHHMNIFKEKYL